MPSLVGSEMCIRDSHSGHRFDAGVARGADDITDAAILSEPPHQRVLTGARTNHQEFHGSDAVVASLRCRGREIMIVGRRPLITRPTLFGSGSTRLCDDLPAWNWRGSSSVFWLTPRHL